MGDERISVAQENFLKQLDPKTDYSQLTKKAASDKIKELKGEKDDQAIDTVKVYEKYAKKAPTTQGTSFYTAYAKDLFIAMYKDGEADKVMAMAILLVKQAKKAFE